MIDKFTIGLSATQVAVVVAVFFVTGIGALLLTIAFRRWNKRKAG